jgi:cytochrome c oxidase subunit 2
MPLFRKPKRWAMALTGLLLAAVLLSACGSDASTLTVAGPIADRERLLFYIILGIATFIFVIVEGVLIFSIVRYRERPGMPNPRQVHGNLRVEVLWTVIPAVFLFIVLGFTIQTLFAVATQPPDPNTVVVEAVGHQWWWEFYYPQYNITTADTLHAPVGTVVNVRLYSNNVIHSFWIPALAGKTDDIPGHNNEKWFKADSPGTYWGECAEFCGVQHAHMDFNVVIDKSANDFNTWVTTQQQAALAPSSSSLAAQGAKVFTGQCESCHGIVGVNLKGDDDPHVKCDNPGIACLVGPNLTHFGSRNLIAGGVLTNNTEACTPAPYNVLIQKCHLAQWLSNPQAVKPGNDMNVNLTPDQVTQLVAYLEGLK